ncbi:hypothetical protein GMORB2_1679, partial [Geosmithia morbida]
NAADPDDKLVVVTPSSGSLPRLPTQQDQIKRVGLDKALYQVEQAVRRTLNGYEAPGTNADGHVVLARLKALLGETAANNGQTDVQYPQQQQQQQQQDEAMMDGDGTGEDEDDDEEDKDTTTSSDGYAAASSNHDHHHGHMAAATSYSAHAGKSASSPETRRLRRFFASGMRANLDVGPDLDPIDLGLTSMDEAVALFHENLAHTRWGMDPRIYTLDYTRSRSAFLTTSIMAASALFWTEGGALSRRLSDHAERLVNLVMQKRYKSVEIVLAFLANVPWMSPGPHSTDDGTSVYISMAMTIAIDLYLHKVIMPTDLTGQGAAVTVSRGDCLDPRTALEMDGFPDLDPLSDRGVLLLRGRERCWISLFVLERGMCLARGRPFAVPVTRSLKVCDDWHKSPLAESQDGPLLSMAIMRRDLDGLFTTVRNMCDASQAPTTSEGSLAAQSIESSIECFFDQWYSNWGEAIGAGPERRLPPYVEILVTHTRLSLYGSVINHPTASIEVRRFFRTAGLSSALNVMRVAIQGETQLRSMPNNTAIMISFAACFALTLSAYATGGSSLAPSVRKLIDEVAGVLVRTGGVTPHRNGLSTLYGRHLRHIVRRAAKTAGPAPADGPLMPRMPVTTTTSPSTTAANSTTPLSLHDFQRQFLWPETLQFSAMSNDQIMHVLSQPDNDFEPTFDGLSWDDMSNFDWLHWPEFGS